MHKAKYIYKQISCTWIKHHFNLVYLHILQATATLLDLTKTTMLTTQSTEDGIGESDDDGDNPNEHPVYMPAPEGDMEIETETGELNKSCSLPMLSIQPTAFEVSLVG